MPTLQSHTHCQAAQASCTSQSLLISVSFPTPGRKESTGIQHCIRTIAGEVVKSTSPIKLFFQFYLKFRIQIKD